MIIFISGGTRSGKSRYAEELAQEIHGQKQQLHQNYPNSPNLYYLATAEALDQEMTNRINRHIEQRDSRWKTIEEAYDLAHVISSCHEGDVILIDCVTIWLNNLMFGLKEPLEQIQERVDRWVQMARGKNLVLLLVSNDVNEGFPNADHMVQQYMMSLERIHQQLVSEADQAIQVIAGNPFVWKSTTDIENK